MDTGTLVVDGKTLKTYSWTPEGEIKALVCLSHGYAERLVPYYSEVAEEGQKHGLLVFGHDHIGHGESEGDRAIVSSMNEYTEPIVQHCQQKTEQHPNVPLFIVGHSMGGLITLHTTLLKHSPTFKGMVLMGPLIKPDPASASKLQIFLAKIACKILPNLQIGGVKDDLVTSNQEWREKFAADDLNHHGGVKAGLGYVLLEAMSQLEEKFSEINIPYLLIMGEKDQICYVEGSKEFHKMTSSDDKSMKVIENGFHHLYIESDEVRKEAISETWNWIVKRV